MAGMLEPCQSWPILASAYHAFMDMLKLVLYTFHDHPHPSCHYSSESNRPSCPSYSSAVTVVFMIDTKDRLCLDASVQMCAVSNKSPI